MLGSIGVQLCLLPASELRRWHKGGIDGIRKLMQIGGWWQLEADDRLVDKIDKNNED